MTFWRAELPEVNMKNANLDPRGRPTVTAGSDHNFHTFCPAIPTFQNLARQNNFHVKILIAIVGTAGLTEWIIDDTCLVIYQFSEY